jgi:hypothetical protein
MNRKTKLIVNFSVYSFLFGILAFALYRKQEYLKHYAFTKGRITEVTGRSYKGSGDYSILYSYKVQNKECHKKEEFNYCGDLNMKKLRALLEGREFTVAYSVSSNGVCTMLMTLGNADGLKYNLADSAQFYDSLKHYDSILTCK